ncbi:MAG: hypothetical protein KF701_07910 [Anaerolineales bacterium]|nr:MAG: hypothetical protein KF701_07910 [Anaerolineales bacterium]
MKQIRTLGIVLVLVQLADVALHVATGQFEPMRVVASLLLAVWALSAGKASLAAGWGALAVYLGLNALFLLQNGVTNPEQGGALRITLFVLVLISTALTILIQRRKR